MSKNKTQEFSKSAFFKATIPSYFFPLISAGLPGYLLNKPDLMHASYSTIALPSLFATILSFIILRQFKKRQIFLFNRIPMTVYLGTIMILLSIAVIFIFQLQDAFLNIVPSAFIGTAIVAMTNPLNNKNKHEKV